MNGLVYVISVKAAASPPLLGRSLPNKARHRCSSLDPQSKTGLNFQYHHQNSALSSLQLFPPCTTY
jgi:hypothetical protein